MATSDADVAWPTVGHGCCNNNVMVTPYFYEKLKRLGILFLTFQQPFKMALLKAVNNFAYHAIFKRYSTYVGFIIVGAFAFERG